MRIHQSLEDLILMPVTCSMCVSAVLLGFALLGMVGMREWGSMMGPGTAFNTLLEDDLMEDSKDGCQESATGG